MYNILAIISSILSMDKEDILKFSKTSPYRYKVYQIPKRSSDEMRTIAQPSKELKFIQNILKSNILEKILPIHSRAFAYKNNVSIKSNAYEHMNNEFLLKMDFKDFFPSISPNVFMKECERNNIIFNSEELNFLINLIFRKKYRNGGLELSIGAPTSPIVSNFIMYTFDEEIYKQCKEKEITYTRYADDITFSSNKRNVLFTIPNLVQSILNEKYNNVIRINSIKTIFSSKAHNRHVTGITLTNNDSLSIGRERKRKIISSVHYYKLGRLNEDEIIKLKGYLSFAFYIEPNFKNMLINKYGIDIIRSLS